MFVDITHSGDSKHTHINANLLDVIVLNEYLNDVSKGQSDRA